MSRPRGFLLALALAAAGGCGDARSPAETALEAAAPAEYAAWRAAVEAHRTAQRGNREELREALRRRRVADARHEVAVAAAKEELGAAAARIESAAEEATRHTRSYVDLVAAIEKLRPAAEAAEAAAIAEADTEREAVYEAVATPAVRAVEAAGAAEAEAREWLMLTAPAAWESYEAAAEAEGGAGAAADPGPVGGPLRWFLGLPSVLRYVAVLFLFGLGRVAWGAYTDRRAAALAERLGEN